MNKSIFSGRLTDHPTTGFTPSNVQVAEFKVAVECSFKDPHSGKPHVEYYKCKVWGHQAEFVMRNFAKGSLVECEGELRVNFVKQSNQSTQHANNKQAKGAYPFFNLQEVSGVCDYGHKYVENKRNNQPVSQNNYQGQSQAKPHTQAEQGGGIASTTYQAPKEPIPHTVTQGFNESDLQDFGH